MKNPAFSAVFLPIAVVLAPAWLAACSPTATYGTGEAPEMALFREVTGGLLATEREEPIEYQPRAPLVLPPTQTAQALPPPTDPAAVNPEWPESRTEQLAETDELNADPRYPGSQAEYRRTRALAGAFPVSPDLDDPSGSPYDIVHSRQQREEFQRALAESKGYGRTERQFLTDPPTAYREPAPTAPSEFEDIDTEGGGGGWLKWLLGGR